MELKDIMDLSEASKKYNIDINTLKWACQHGSNGLEEGVDYKKSGRVWLITRQAIEKTWREEKMKLKLNTKLENLYLGIKTVDGMEQERSFSFLFKNEVSPEQLIIMFHYVLETQYLYFTPLKGSCYFKHDQNVWSYCNENLYNQELDEEDDYDKYVNLIKLTDFEKSVLKEVERIIEEKDYTIIK